MSKRMLIQVKEAIIRLENKICQRLKKKTKLAKCVYILKKKESPNELNNTKSPGHRRQLSQNLFLGVEKH